MRTVRYTIRSLFTADTSRTLTMRDIRDHLTSRRIYVTIHAVRRVVRQLVASRKLKCVDVGVNGTELYGAGRYLGKWIGAAK